jgi:hypothetical protein
MRRPSALVPERTRKISGGFSFIQHRFLLDGFLESLTMAELSLYVFLVVAGDRNGVSWYGYDRICSMLRMDLELYLEARNGLIDKDLVAFDGSRFQVLSLPDEPIAETQRVLKTPGDMAAHDPAAIRNLIHRSLEEVK